MSDGWWAVAERARELMSAHSTLGGPTDGASLLDLHLLVVNIVTVVVLPVLAVFALFCAIRGGGDPLAPGAPERRLDGRTYRNRPDGRGAA